MLALLLLCTLCDSRRRGEIGPDGKEYTVLYQARGLALRVTEIEPKLTGIGYRASSCRHSILSRIATHCSSKK